MGNILIVLVCPGTIEKGENIQTILRLLRERPHPDLRNEPSLDGLELPAPNPFRASGFGLDSVGH